MRLGGLSTGPVAKDRLDPLTLQFVVGTVSVVAYSGSSLVTLWIPGGIGFIYGPVAHIPPAATFTRFVAVPLVVISPIF